LAGVIQALCPDDDGQRLDRGDRARLNTSDEGRHSRRIVPSGWPVLEHASARQ